MVLDMMLDVVLDMVLDVVLQIQFQVQALLSLEMVDEIVPYFDKEVAEDLLHLDTLIAADIHFHLLYW